jgi:hypothetical protein
MKLSRYLVCQTSVTCLLSYRYSGTSVPQVSCLLAAHMQAAAFSKCALRHADKEYKQSSLEAASYAVLIK